MRRFLGAFGFAFCVLGFQLVGDPSAVGGIKVKPSEVSQLFGASCANLGTQGKNECSATCGWVAIQEIVDGGDSKPKDAEPCGSNYACTAPLGLQGACSDL